MSNNCKICGRRCEGLYCFRHKPRKSLKSRKTFKRELKKSSVSNTAEFFMKIWTKREHVSEVSGEKLFSPPSSAYFHHILPKRKHSEAMYDEENVILLTIDEHTNVESDMYRYEKINKKRKQLIDKYNQNN